jgi:hypothetical protein
VGHCYYNHWYLSRELRKLGWRADVMNTDTSPANAQFYHGEDVTARQPTYLGIAQNMLRFVKALFRYDIFHFSNAEGLNFPPFNQIGWFRRWFGPYAEARLLRALGKKITYSTNGCRDGVTQTRFNQWGPYPVCDSCAWKNQPAVCSDAKNDAWGRARNALVDYIALAGSNRADYNESPKAHEAPWAFSLDKNLWRPDLLVPSNYLLPFRKSTIKVYHSVGNYDTRSHGAKRMTIKSTEIWIDLIERLKAEGHDVELIFFTDVPNRQMRYYQAQADIFVEMLTFGYFGANIREAMLLGKPAICYLRPEWLDDMRREVPEYVDELPVISATPETAYETLKELVVNAERRRDIGARMRAFGEKWHASDAAAVEADKVLTALMQS